MPISSLLLNNKTSGTIPVGTLIVIDGGQARAYDPLTDNIEDVIGSVPALQNVSGRQWGPLYEGAECYNNDSIYWNEDLTYEVDEENNPVPNESYVPFNPYAQTADYTIVVYIGFAAVLHSYESLPARWQRIQTGTLYDWVFIR